MKLYGFFCCFLGCKKKPHRGGYVVGETRISIVPPMRKKFLKTIHYGLRKGNKKNRYICNDKQQLKIF